MKTPTVCSVVMMSVLFLFSCADFDSFPTASMPLGKANDTDESDPQDPECLIVRWECGANTWMAAEDSVWTVFQGNKAFQISNDGVLARVRSDNRLVLHDDLAVFHTTEEGQCIVASTALNDTTHIRIYKGYLWEDMFGRYYLKQNDETYLITRRYLTSEGELTPPREIIWARDFSDYWNRHKPRPETGLTHTNGHIYYLPFNYDLDELDELGAAPKDDSDLLIDPLCRDCEEIEQIDLCELKGADLSGEGSPTNLPGGNTSDGSPQTDTSGGGGGSSGGSSQTDTPGGGGGSSQTNYKQLTLLDDCSSRGGRHPDDRRGCAVFSGTWVSFSYPNNHVVVGFRVADSRAEGDDKTAYLCGLSPGSATVRVTIEQGGGDDKVTTVTTYAVTVVRTPDGECR